jgi:ABC-type cobalamin/Fe3+-siderophores transport system ATPase subunit
MFKFGPECERFFQGFDRFYKQGMHVVISGATGTGKSTLARRVYESRAQRGGFVIVFFNKIKPDLTFTHDYKGWTRWTEFKKRPSRHENRVILYPKVEHLGLKEAIDVHREVFRDALDRIVNVGHWTVGLDEALYLCHPRLAACGDLVAGNFILSRSAAVSMVALMQRPAHVPLEVYGAASAAFIGQTREAADLKRLAELDTKQNARDLQAVISGLARHEYLAIPVASGDMAQIVDAKR